MPPVDCKAWEYGVPVVPPGSDEVVIAGDAEITVVYVFVAWFPRLSVKETV